MIPLAMGVFHGAFGFAPPTTGQSSQSVDERIIDMVKTCTRQGLIVAALTVATGLAVQAQRGRDGARDDAEDNKALAARFTDFKPVTDAILEKPDPADWLHWRQVVWDQTVADNTLG